MSFTYTLQTGGGVLRSDGASIPNVMDNIDWQAYQVWLAAGNTPTPTPTPPVVTPTLTFLQFMALFTAAEQSAIFASNDTQTKMFITMAAGSGGLQLTNPEVTNGVNYLASGPALITTAEAARILAGTAST